MSRIPHFPEKKYTRVFAPLCASCALPYYYVELFRCRRIEWKPRIHAWHFRCISVGVQCPSLENKRVILPPTKATADVVTAKEFNNNPGMEFCACLMPTLGGTPAGYVYGPMHDPCAYCITDVPSLNLTGFHGAAARFECFKLLELEA